MTDWISVADRMPDHRGSFSDTVIVACDEGRVLAASLRAPIDREPATWVSHGYRWPLPRLVTHWMPMPAPPAAKGGE